MKRAALLLAAAILSPDAYRDGYRDGYAAGRASHQNVNDLISVGYVVTDPDGFICTRWDEGPAAPPIPGGP